MSVLDIISVLFKVVQYVAISLDMYCFHQLLSDNTLKTDVKFINKLTDWVIGVLLLHLVSAVPTISMKAENGIVYRDDIPLMLFHIILSFTFLFMSERNLIVARRNRSVQYVALKYHVESAEALKIVEAFEMSRFPTDHFEGALLGLTESQKQAKTIEDVEVLARAKSKLDEYSDQAKAYCNALENGRGMRLLDFPGCDDGKGKRYI